MAYGYSPFNPYTPQVPAVFGTSHFGSGLGPGGPYIIDDGYGAEPYGSSSYGSTLFALPSVGYAVSLDTYRLELFFSQPMKATDPNLIAPASYSIEPIFGAAPSPSISSVTINSYNNVDIYSGLTAQGVMSVIITHSGSTLGGIYRLRVVVGIKDIMGNPMVIPPNTPENPLNYFDPTFIQSNKAVFFTRGGPPTFTATAPSGGNVLVQFSEDMIPEATVTPGIEDLTAYSFVSNPSYPVTLTATAVDHPFLGVPSMAMLNVSGMTTLPYTLTLAPALSVAFDGTYLPSASTSFTGTELGIGTSVAFTSLSLSKLMGNTYGWQFEDTTGRVSATCSYAMGITVDVSSMNVFPALQNGVPLATISFDDGTNLVQMELSRLAGNDVVNIVGVGTYSVAWSTGGPVTFWLYRNQMASTYSFLRGTDPFMTTDIATFIGGGSTPGMSLLLAANYELSNFRIALARITASATVFSGSWNFLHEQTATFTGSGALTRRTLLTQRGPLVKGWGDATPASIDDVTVEVNGTAVDVGYVNPYIGQIMTLIPIPLMAPGAITVTVDYKWFYNPIMDMIGLNTNGLVLNKWNRPLGHHFPPAHGEQIQTLPAYPKGVPDRMRFQMSVVLGPSERPDPLLIGHRFHALERDYTASLNDPTLMLLNQNPHSIAVPGLESIPEGETVSYEGLQTPLLETPTWLLAGVDSGAVDAGQGTYTLIDADSKDSSSPLPALITSTLNPPYDLRLVSVPSFVDTRTLVFAIDGTEATATFWGQAATVSSTTQTWNFTGGKTLLVKVDGGAVQTVTFIDADFFNPAAASASEVSAVINAQLAGGTAVPSTSIGLYSNTKGTGSIIQVTGGTANAAGLLEFSTVAQTGDGSVADMSAVTLSEVHTLIEAALASCYVATPLPFTIYTRSRGNASTIQVLGTSTADTQLGLDLNLHTGSDSGDTTAFYYRNIDLSFPSSVVCATRFKVNSTSSYHGIFTGVGFGIHNNHSVWAVGCLLINNVKHIGFLTDAANPQDQASWEIGPTVSGTVISATTLTATTTALPVGIRAGSRFQIFTGGQVGVYTLASVVHQTTGISTLTITGSFPANYRLWGNRDISMVFEIAYDTVLSYQLTASPDTGGATLYVSGGLSGSFLTTTSASVFPDPAQTGLMLSAEGDGQVFWGSYSREAANSSTWSFFRYGIQPDQRRISGRGLVVASMMSDIPREDPNSVWFRTQGFGFDRIETLTNRLLLKNGCASDALDFSYGYGRIEPFLVSGVHVDVDATFQMDSCTQGSGDLQIQVQNTKKQVVFSPLMYVDPSGILPRRLISSPQLSASCLFLPTSEAAAWTTYNGPTSQIDVKTLTIWGPGGYQADLDLTNADYPDTGGRILEGRLAITQYNPLRPIEVVLAANAGGVAGPARAVIATWRVVGGVPLVTLCSDLSVPIIDYAFDWTAGDLHTYRLVLDEALDSVILSIDDTVYPPGALSAFDPAADNTRMRFGIDGFGTVVETKWDYVHVHVTPPANAKRTLGVWLGGDLDDIDEWEIPRTDSSSLPNSSADPAVVIQDMDWQNEMDVRIHWDAGWGVTVLRPDLPPPPYFTGDFATEITEPSAGWINVETGNLPANTTGDIFGSVKFGALRKESISQQRWREIRYRLYNWPSQDFRSGHHMVLNQSHVITSGEPTLDTTPETITVTSLDNKHLTLLPGRIYASQIYSVVDNGTLISSSYWTFNTETQMLTLVPDTLGNVVTFSGDHVPVTVVFSPGKPYTTTYLEGQPLLDSTTLLNEGTPPFYKHQIAPDVSTVQFGTQINNPMGTLNDAPPDFILNDPYRFVSFVEEGDALYTNLTPIQVDNDGSVDMIQSICDEWSAMEFSGDFFTEWLAPKPQDAFSQGAGMNIMMISGGAKSVGGLISGGGLGGGSGGIGAVLYPSLGVEVTWVLNLSAVITDTTGLVEQDLAEVDILNEYADEVPPTGHATDLLAPDGIPTIGGVPLAPGAHGHGNIYLTFTVDGSYAHIGPWGGMDSLIPGAQEIIGPEIAGVPVGLPFTHGSFLYGSNAAQPTGVPANAGMILVGGAVLPATGTYSVGIDAAN